MKKTAITHIHESIIIRILCLLPTDSVIRCRSVCKNWATLICTPYFAESYSSNGTAPLHFLLHGIVRISQKHKHLVFADLAQASCNAHAPRSDCPVPVKTKSVLPHILDSESSPYITVCSTCNFTGFIVAYAYPRHADQFGHPYYIFNPITSQHIVVQQNNKNKWWRNCALLLAHKTNQLKLLKFTCQDEVEIQTIGTDLWRTVTNSTGTDSQRTVKSSVYLSLVDKNFGFPCFLNGIYHWSSYTFSRSIVCFNPDEEVFDQILTPPWIADYNSAYLGLLDGCLCICIKTLSVNDFEFWVMNEYGVRESWVKKLVIPNDWKQRTLSEPLRFLKYGETVVLCDNYVVICYNPSTGNRTFITYYSKDDRHLLYAPIPYVPNFRRFVYG